MHRPPTQCLWKHRERALPARVALTAETPCGNGVRLFIERAAAAPCAGHPCALGKPVRLCDGKTLLLKSKLKHVDCRQEWVRVLRDRDICTPVHVDRKDNLADLFTKILTAPEFERLRGQIMYNMESD